MKTLEVLYVWTFFFLFFTEKKVMASLLKEMESEDAFDYEIPVSPLFRWASSMGNDPIRQRL